MSGIYQSKNIIYQYLTFTEHKQHHHPNHKHFPIILHCHIQNVIKYLLSKVKYIIFCRWISSAFSLPGSLPSVFIESATDRYCILKIGFLFPRIPLTDNKISSIYLGWYILGSENTTQESKLPLVMILLSKMMIIFPNQPETIRNQN